MSIISLEKSLNMSTDEFNKMLEEAERERKAEDETSDEGLRKFLRKPEEFDSLKSKITKINLLIPFLIMSIIAFIEGIIIFFL